MQISLRSALTTGIATVTVSAVALAPAIQTLPAHDAVVPRVVSTQAWLPTAGSTYLEDVSAWVQNVLLPSAGASFPTPIPNEAVEVTGINDSIKNIYNAIEPWVEWGFDVAAYVVGWIPWVGWFAPQISILYDFGEAIVRTFVFNGADWLFGPLGFNQKVSNIIRDTWDASWQLLWDEIDWLIPGIPIPLPPLPPCPDILCGGWIGDAVVTASGWLRDGSLWIWNLWDEPIKGWIDSGVTFATDIMDSIDWIPFVPLIRFETNSIWGLTEGLGDALVYFAKDMITAGDQAVADFFNGGLITAAANATQATWNSIILRGGEAIDAFVAFIQEQWDYFTGGFLDQRLSSTTAGVQRTAAADGLAALVDNVRAALNGGAESLGGSLNGDVTTLAASLNGDVVRLRSAVREDFANLRAALNGDVAGLPAGLDGGIATLRATLNEDIANLGAALRGAVAGTAVTAEGTPPASGDDSVTGEAAGGGQSSAESDRSGHGFGRGERFHHVRGLGGRSEAAATGQTKDAVSSSTEDQGGRADSAVAGGEAQSEAPARGTKFRPGRHGYASGGDRVTKDGVPGQGGDGGKRSDQQGAAPDRSDASTGRADKPSDQRDGMSNGAGKRSHERDVSSGTPRKSSGKPSGPSAKRSAESPNKVFKGRGSADNGSGETD